jgi:2-amino-4-hydroxy-6-hydroxymethyldihydropteridine diphosphokinase
MSGPWACAFGMTHIYLSLGSNVGDRLDHLQQALRELESAQVHIRRVSKIYETEPYGYRAQSWFLNLVAEVETRQFPLQLLQTIHRIERKLKRRRTIRNGPRTIDIDIVLYGNAAMQSAALTIPHPRYQERAFVLAPLSDLIPTGVPHRRPRVYSQSIMNSGPSHAKYFP